MRRLAYLMSVALAATLTACANPEAGDTEGDSVVVVPRWEFNELGRIGGLHVERDQEFSSSRMTVKVARDGRIYVLDRQMAVVRVFRRDGSMATEFGGAGSGPGELSSPTGLTILNNDMLLVPNAFNRRYTIFDLDGRLRKTMPRESSRVQRRQFDVPRRTDSTFVDNRLSSTESEIRVSLVEVDTSGQLMETLSDFRMAVPRRGPVRPLQPGSDWREVLSHFSQLPFFLVENGGSHWIFDAHEGRLVHRSPHGDTLASVDVSAWRVEPSRAEWRLIRSGLRDANLQLRDVDLARPVFRTLLPVHGGGVLAVLAGEFGAPLPIAEWFGSDGDARGRVELGFLPAEDAGSDVVGDTIFTIAVGELDVPFVIWGILQDREVSHEVAR